MTSPAATRRLPPLPARRRAGPRAGPDYGRSDEPDWRQIDWRTALRRVTVRGASVTCVELGEGDGGPPVLFVHGLAGCWQNWLENIAPVARSRRVIAADLPGFGFSSLGPEAVSIGEYAELLDALCDELDTGPIALVGNSMGGFIGAELALRHPQRLERLALVDAAGISLAKARKTPLRLLVRGVAARGAHAPVSSRATFRRPGIRHLALASVVRHPTRVSLDLLCSQIDGTGAPGFVPAMEAMLSYDFCDRLPRVACPTLVVHGADDMLVPLRDAHEFARLIPNTRLVVFEDTGHMPMIERPVRFNGELLRFLTDGEAPAAAASSQGRDGTRR